MLQKLGRFVIGGRAALEDPSEALREIHADAVESMLLLRQHANMAPQDYSRDGLERLAAAAREQVDSLRACLRERGLPVPPEPSAPTIAIPTSHWARLVQDLERHRASSRRLRELAAHFADSHPSVAAFLNQLCQQNLHACERLRTLIARADPQALD
jgi:hypothetical protein